MVLVDLATATICFLNRCYPALVGAETPTDQFRLEQVRTKQPGYGGDVMLLKGIQTSVFAIYRV